MENRLKAVSASEVLTISGICAICIRSATYEFNAEQMRTVCVRVMDSGCLRVINFWLFPLHLDQEWICVWWWKGSNVDYMYVSQRILSYIEFPDPLICDSTSVLIEVFGLSGILITVPSLNPTPLCFADPGWSGKEEGYLPCSGAALYERHNGSSLPCSRKDHHCQELPPGLWDRGETRALSQHSKCFTPILGGRSRMLLKMI